MTVTVGGFVIRGGARVVGGGAVSIRRGVAMRSRMVGLRMVGRAGITLSSLAINSSGMVASSQIFIENGSIRAVEGVLLPISMAVMVDLKTNKD